MSYCNIHGRYDGDGCPTCRDVESEIIDSLARSREDLATAAAHIAHAENNPGDYVCPSCMFRTLKKGASRCPKCHADPGRQYWVDVTARERAQEIAAAEEWERGRPAREAKEAKDRARAATEEFKGKMNMVIIGIGVLYWLYELVDIWRHSWGFQGSGLFALFNGIGSILNLAIGGVIMGVVIGFGTWAVVAVADFLLDAFNNTE
ncbi:MAG TPA: hypothetical protein VMV97_04730 [Sulfuriferula sp.]|nr:hypothetical protein [Sulfuriferula sp.]